LRWTRACPPSGWARSRYPPRTTHVFNHTYVQYAGDPVLSKLAFDSGFYIPRDKSTASLTWAYQKAKCTLEGRRLGKLPNYDEDAYIRASYLVNTTVQLRFHRSPARLVHRHQPDERYEPGARSDLRRVPYYDINWFDSTGRSFYLQLTWKLGGKALLIAGSRPPSWGRPGGWRRQAFLRPRGDPRGALPCRRHVQAQLPAAIEHVLGAARPFLIAQVIDFRLREAAAEIGAEVFHALRRAENGPGAGAIGAREAVSSGGQGGYRRGQRFHEAFEIIARNVAAGQVGARRPVTLRAGKKRQKLLQRVLGQLAVGGDLAAEHAEQRGLAVSPIDIEHIVAR